ncbi:MAG: N-acetyltransferase family protein [Phascolarctobacterium sp.]|nr:N-acetyltransferase family protein [Phascolarctobacterium sp.]
MKEAICVRAAMPQDAEQLLEIYTPFVISEDCSVSNVSFELEAPSVEEFRQRIVDISSKYPYLVGEKDGQILGYVYCHPYRERLAYQWSVEVTIYLAPAGQGKGLGRVLYEAMEEILRLQGITMLYSCITLGNEHSIKMHEALGYRLIGTFSKSGYKNGQWLDTVWLEKQLQPCPKQPDNIKSWRELDPDAVAAVLTEATAKLQCLKL